VTALGGRAIERAEAERMKKGAVEVPPAGERPVKQMRDVARKYFDPEKRVEGIVRGVGKTV